MLRLSPLVIIPVALIVAAVIALVIVNAQGSTRCLEAQSDGPPPDAATAWAKLEPSERATMLAQAATHEYYESLTPAPTTEIDLPPGIMSETLTYYPEWGTYFTRDPSDLIRVDGWIDVRPPQPWGGGAVGGITGLPDVSGC